jgi:hypothetical protein
MAKVRSLHIFQYNTFPSTLFRPQGLTPFKLLMSLYIGYVIVNPLNAELNPICDLMALLRTHHVVHVRGLINTL